MPKARFGGRAPGLRVRMAVHTGAADYREGDYFGPALNRVARLLAAGHGGQVLLSAATAGQLLPKLLAEINLRSLGVHRLRDIAAREAIFQLLAPGLPTHFPPLNTLDVAFRRGVRRAAAVASVIVAAIGTLAFSALRLAELRQQALIASHRLLYAAQMNWAQHAWEDGNVGRAEELVAARQPKQGQEDLRGFEWRYLWRLCQGNSFCTLRGHTATANAVAFSPDGSILATASGDATVRLWRAATFAEAEAENVRSAARSSHGLGARIPE